MSHPTSDTVRQDKERHVIRLRKKLGEKRAAIVNLLEEMKQLEVELEATIVHYTKCWPDHPLPE